MTLKLAHYTVHLWQAFSTLIHIFWVTIRTGNVKALTTRALSLREVTRYDAKREQRVTHDSRNVSGCIGDG